MKRFLLGILIACSFSSAQAVTINPVRVFVDPKGKAARVQIENETETDAVYDLRVKSWKAMDEKGVDTLEDTEAIVTSRPVLNVPAKKTATFRVVVNSRSDAAQDHYRIVISDITPVKDGQTAIRVTNSLPLFVLNDASAKGRLELKDGVVTNVGGKHMRITKYVDIHGKEVGTLLYVLPGQSMKLPVRRVDDITASDSPY